MLVPESKNQESVKERVIEDKDSQVVIQLENKLKLAEEAKKDLTKRPKTLEESKAKLQHDHKEATRCPARFRAGAFTVTPVPASNQPRGHGLRQQSLRC